MKLTFKTLKFSKNKSNILKSICSLVVWFITNISINRIEQHNNLTLCFKKVADFLDITEDQLELIMDILSGNPYRIFKATGSVSDSDKKQSTGSTPLTRRSSVKTTQYVSSGYLFLKSRILTLWDMIKCEKAPLEHFGSIWIKSFEQVFRGKCNLKKLSKIFNYDNQFMKFLVARRNIRGKKIQ